MAAPSKLSGAVSVEFDVPAPMRDGVTLRANVYRPAGDGPWPTLLTRVPYSKDEPSLLSLWLDPLQAARAGFIVVVQDTRGRFASEGEWTPLRYEREDGYDSVEWAAQLPGSNGKVGMFGASYLGNTQWMAAIKGPPSLAAIAPGLTWSEPLDGLFARGGALELGLALPWTLQMGADYLQRLPISDAERADRLGALLDDFDRLTTEGYWELPISDMAMLGRHGLPDLGTIRMLHDPEIVGWSRVAGQHQHVTVPSLHIGGWYDICLQGTLDNYVAMAELGKPARLIVGPWSHIDPFADPVGELCFGIRANAHAAPEQDLTSLHLDWFAQHLSDDEPALEPQAPAVRIFVMGRNEWREETTWPPSSRPERWFLAGGGTLRNDEPDPAAGHSAFTYDPADPVPTLGGHGVLEAHFPPGAFDQRAVEARPDVCVFTSEPLREDLEVIGRVRAVLHAQSSAPSTDWVARLCDVHPDGRSFNVCDGIRRVTEGANATHRVEIDLWSTSIAFLAGHRLRVHITSSSFPRWDRNLNTGRQHEARFEAARQHIYLDTERPSFIELPVVRP